MQNQRRRMIEGWLDKASNQLQVAREHQKSYYLTSEAIEMAQESVELSVKSVLAMLEINYPRSHSIATGKEPFLKIASQIEERGLSGKLEQLGMSQAVPLARLLFLLNFWAQFYEVSKYGFEAGNLAPAKELFNTKESELAVTHADECLRAANHLRYLSEDKFAELLSSST